MSSDLVDRQRSTTLFTWTAQRAAQPIEITGGKGARFSTADGREWLDLGSVTWNANLGHGHEGMRQKLARAAERGLLSPPSGVFPEKAQAAEKLLSVAPPGLSKVFFCLGGAEANENAVKMARLVTRRHKVIARTRSYHGATLAMLSLSGDPRGAPFEPALPGVVRMGDPYCYRCPFGKERQSCHLECADDLETVLFREGPETVAAVILEGVVGANGVFVPRPGYWRRIRELCDRHGILLIADEVLSGFGRTGKWFAVQHDEVTPDLLTCAKGLTAGYAPGGAVLVRDKLAQRFDEEVLLCGLTAYAHPLVCAAVVAAIESYEEEGLIERSARMGAWLSERLARFASHRPHVGEVRGLGMLWALELVVDGPSRAPATPEHMAALARELKARCIWAHKRDNLLYLAPPLCVSEDDLEEALERIGESIDVAFGS